MITLAVGNTIKISSSVWDFCGTPQNGIYVHNVEVNLEPLKNPSQCQDISGLELDFKLVAIAGSAECDNCTPGKTYLDLGTAITDEFGVAYKNHLVTTTDLSFYQDATNLGYSLRLIVCITNSKGQYIITNRCTEPLKISESIPTHRFDMIVEPYPPYDPNSLSIEITKKIADIDGIMINLMTKFGLIGYEYLYTEVIQQNENVIIRSNFRQTSSALVIPWVDIGLVVMFSIGVALIILSIGSIRDWIWCKIGGDCTPTLSNADFLEAANKYIQIQLKNCYESQCKDITNQDEKVDCISKCTTDNLNNWKNFMIGNGGIKGVYPDANPSSLDTAKTKAEQCLNTYNSSPKTKEDYDKYELCIKTEVPPLVEEFNKNILIIYNPDANVGDKEKKGGTNILGTIVFLSLLGVGAYAAINLLRKKSHD